MKTVILCLSALLGLSHVAHCASISAIMGGGLTGGKPGQFLSDYNPANQTGIQGAIFGTENLNPIPDDNGVYVDYMKGESLVTTDKKVFVSTTVRRNGTSFFTTTQSWFDESFGGVVQPMVQLKGFWEFTVQGNYSYKIKGQASVGTAATELTGTVSSGIYRLIFDHRNFSPNVTGPGDNLIGGTNLDIAFTFDSEDNNPVPEPTSVAVFGLLGLGGAIAKWRRKK